MKTEIYYRKNLRQTIRFLFVITIAMIVAIGLMEIFQPSVPDKIDTSDVRKYIFYLWGVTFIYSAIMFSLDYYNVDIYSAKGEEVIYDHEEKLEKDQKDT